MEILALLAIGGIVLWAMSQFNQGGNCCGIVPLPDTSGATTPDVGTSNLSDIVANLESSGGLNVGSQPAGMVDPTYGQYSGFTTQYGSGAAGVNNFAQQMLSYNPNATLGDYYSTYVLGTGNPATIYTTADLQARQPAAYNNLLKNAGVSLTTPLAQLL